MAWASRSTRDEVALQDYVDKYSDVLSAWATVPGLNVSLDQSRVDAALEKRDRQKGKAVASEV